MSVEGQSRIDMPKQIVRPLREGEEIPFYSTLELLLGARHAAPIPGKYVEPVAPHPGPSRDARMKAYAHRKTAAAEKFSEYIDTVREMLSQHALNRDIAGRIKRSVSYLEVHIRANPELRSLSLARPTNRCQMEAK